METYLWAKEEDTARSKYASFLYAVAVLEYLFK